jgi:parvulin-like peptidyl-prolyl isomerase
VKEQGKEQKSEAAAGVETAGVITVQHVLIGFQGSVPGKPITRTRDEAKTLAEELFQKAKAGEDFDAMVKQYTDDSHPGIYSMADSGIPADPAKGVYPRNGMIPAFGNVGFALKAGEIGMAAYDEQASPYGWHIIKRIK